MKLKYIYVKIYHFSTFKATVVLNPKLGLFDVTFYIEALFVHLLSVWIPQLILSHRNFDVFHPPSKILVYVHMNIPQSKPMH